MRSIKRGAFIVDIGRKELYSRRPVVDGFWSELLGCDYRPYEHRIGVLTDGLILEWSPTFRGVRRGIPWPTFIGSMVDLGWSWTKSYGPSSRNYEEFWYRTCGRRFSQLFAQGFWEKFSGVRWADMPPPNGGSDGGRGVLDALRVGFGLGGDGDHLPHAWRHPSKGTGQITDLLVRGVNDAGGQIMYGASVSRIEISSSGGVTHVRTRVQGEEVSVRPEYVIGALPVETLDTLLTGDAGPGFRSLGHVGRRAVVLAYLFFDEPPRFPHAWLEVTTHALKAGRITNYAAFSEDMVPAGKTALCIEYFCDASDPIVREAPENILARAMRECAASRLVDPRRLVDSFVMRLPAANAATSWRDWSDERRRSQVARVQAVRNLYFVNRPGTDIATEAGLTAAEAIIHGDRSAFDQMLDDAMHLRSRGSAVERMART